MSDDLNTEIKIGADASGVEAGVSKAKRSLASLGDAANKAGKDSGKGIELLGVGGDKAAKKVESATRSMQNSIQRLIAEQKAGEKGSRAYYEALADSKDISRNSLKPLLDQLDAAKRKTDEAKDAAEGWRGSLGKINGVAIGAAFAAAVVGVSAMVKKTIDAADSFSKLSAKSGIAVESLRELNYAASLSDVSTESLATGVRKLSQNMAAAAGGAKQQTAAFDAIGVSVKNVDGSLKGADQMVKELASKFATFKDGPEKAALAIELFGKQGAEMIPLLNGGAAGLAEMADEANRLGIVFDGDLAKNAEAFNDNLTRIQTSAEGAAVAITKELLPTLNNLAQAFVDAQGDGQSFASWLGSGLRTVVEAATIAIANVSFVLTTLGRDIGAIGAAYVSLAKLDIQGFKAISEAVKEDDKEARRVLDKFTFDLLNARFLTSKAGAGRGTAPDPRALSLPEISAPIVKQSEAATKGVKTVVSEYDKLIQKLSLELPKAAAEAEAAQNGYNKAQTEFVALANSPAWAKFTNQQRANVAALFENKIASEQAADATKALNKANEEAGKAREKYLTSLDTGLDKIQADIAAQIEATERMGLSKEAIAELDAAKLEMLATDLELQAIKAMDRNLDQQTYDALKKQAAAYRELGIAKKGGAAKEAAQDLEKANAEAAKKAQEDWERASEQINNTLTDALMRGFESGKDFAKNMRDTVVNMFKTMVLRPVISAIINPISGALTGMMGLSGAAQAATGGAGALSTVGSIGSGVSMLSGLGAFGGGVAGGFGGLMGSLGMSAAGTTLGGAVSAGGIALGAGNIAGGLGTLAGALGPIAIGIALLSSLIKKSTPHMGAASSYSAETGLVSGVDVYRASGLADTRTYSAEAEKVTATVAQSIAMALDSTATAFGKKAGYEISTAFADDKSKDGAWGSLIIKQMGEAVLDWRDTQTSKWAPKEFADGEQGGKEYQQAIAKSVREVIDGMGLPEWAARITRALPESATMDDLTAALAQVQAAPAALLQQFGTTRDALVQQFAQGLASGDAMAAGQSVADTLVASIQNAIYTNAAGQIFDIVNMGIVTPMLDAIATGASVADALSQATIDKTIERAKAQAQVLGELFGNQEFAAAMEQLRTAVGGALGQAGGYLQALPQTLVATQQIDTAAQDAARAADEAQKAWQQITDGLLSDQASLQIDLLRAQGREEEALARERALAIEGMDAYQTALYDSNRSLRSQIDTLRELGDLLPAVIDQYLTPEQRTSNAYSGIASDLVGAGLAGMDAAALAQALAGATKGEIAEAATAIYQMTGVTDEMRVALLRAAGSLATLKDEAASVADAGLDTAYGALERAVQARRSVVQETVNDVRAVFDTVRGAARDLFGEVDSVVQFNAQAGRAYITQALGAARSTGYLPDGEQLSEAIGAARAGLNAQTFASQAEADFQRLVLANELRDLQDISGDQLTEAEKQLKALDGILDSARAQIDALRGIDSSVMSVEAAIAALAVAMARESAESGGAGGVAGKPAVTLPGYLQGGNGAAYDLKSDTGYQAGTGLPWMGQTIREAASELVQAGNAKAVYDAIAASGFTLSQADSILQIPAGTAEEWARSVGLPVFHTGTNFVPQTGLALLEKGEAVIPRAYNPAALGMGGNTERLEQLVEGMAAELAQMRAQLDVANRHAARTAEATNGRPEAPVLVEVVA